MSVSKFVSPNAVHAVQSDGFYTEYDAHGRVVYSLDKWNFWSMLFYPERGITPNFVLHKYFHIYNPQGMLPQGMLP